MFRIPSRLPHIIPVIIAVCPTISYAADDNFCKPKAQEECLTEFADDLKSLKKCQDAFADLKRLCQRNQRKQSMAHRAPKLTHTEAIADAVTPPPPLPQHNIFIRADRLDNPYPGLTVTSGQALGASVSYTDNDFVQSTVKTKSGSFVTVSTSQSVQTTGLASYAFVKPGNDRGWSIFNNGEFGGENVLFVPSLWVSANGNWDHPTKAFGDTSALKVGPEFDFLFVPTEEHNTFLSYFGVAPFYQTDFYSQAQAEGVTLRLRPLIRLRFPFA